jgi:hypothetical protein
MRSNEVMLNTLSQVQGRLDRLRECNAVIERVRATYDLLELEVDHGLDDNVEVVRRLRREARIPEGIDVRDWIKIMNWD